MPGVPKLSTGELLPCHNIDMKQVRPGVEWARGNKNLVVERGALKTTIQAIIFGVTPRTSGSASLQRACLFRRD